jgi:tRNA dimethylallyltransferase
MKKIPLIVVAGPTASGKTDVSVKLAKMLDAEIVSADSMQLYRGLDVGSAKPTEEEMDGVRHYMIGEIDPREDFSAAEYAEAAHKYIADINARGKLPLLVGGTGLYIRSVVNDVDFGKEQTDTDLRRSLSELADEKGGAYMLDILREFDSVSANRLHENNLRRIIRAIEFYRITGIPISEHQAETQKKESRYDVLGFVLERNREELYRRIDRRVLVMLKNGLIDEVRALMDYGCTKDMTSMQGIGYKEVIAYLRGFLTYGEMVGVVQRGSRRYAKRQITWFKRDADFIRIICGSDSADTAEVMYKKVKEYYMPFARKNVQK